MQNKNPRILFVINTYPSNNREVELVKTLDSIFSQTHQNFEVFLVENHLNQEKILPIINKYQNKEQKITIVNDSKKRLSYLFNVGWKNAHEELLAYVADDVELEPQWLEEALKEMERDEQIAVVTGPIISACYPAGEMHRLYLLSQKNIFFKILAWPYIYFTAENSLFAPGKLFESGAYSFGASLEEAKSYKKQEIDLATTSSMLIKRSIIEKIGGFDESFSFNHADGDLFIRIKKADYKIIFNPKVVSKHNMRMGPSRNAYIIGLDTGIYYKKHVKPKTLRGTIGAFINIAVLNNYWIYNAIRTRKTDQLKGIAGFIKGIFGER